MQRPFWREIILLMGFGIFPSILRAEIPTTPFVAGFDRFAKHKEIEKTQAGRLLLTELSCTACHASPQLELQPKRGPRLTGAGNRLHPNWIKKFLASPQTTKPGTTMPEMFHDWSEADKSRAIDALAAFLTSQQEAYPDIKASGLVAVPFEFWAKGDADVGQQLYHQIGCVACHAPDPKYETADTKPSPTDQLLDQLDPEELAELGLAGKARRVESIPHSDLGAKYSRRSLTDFLFDPEHTRPSGRMPNLKLKATEAADIAAYLLRDQKPRQELTNPQATEAMIQQGQKLFVELRCSNCHEATGTKPAPMTKDLNQGFLQPKDETCIGKPKRGMPLFSLSSEQVNSLIQVFRVPTVSAANDRLQLSLLQLNCFACHEREDQGGVGRYRKAYFETVGNVDIGDEGRLPPPLTGVGNKLQPTWLNQVLKGSGGVRPHMRIRMPQFPAKVVKPLPELFAEVDQADNKPASEAEVFGKVEGLAVSGRLLLDNGCVQCHAFRGETLPGVVGVDLENIAQRVQPKWFHDFLLNPGSLKPRTRMPTFFPGGISQNKAVLEGDTERQIAAMWAFLKNLEKQPLPEKIEAVRSQDFELKPSDGPIVLRTFMKEAGTHAIAVGFPQGVNFAFDAEQSRLAALWRGRFLDAQGTWFSRFTPPAKPLGEDLIILPAGLPFGQLKDSREPWPKVDPRNPTGRYLGYRLDAEGVPTFLYRYENYDIEDRMEPIGETQIQRQWIITNRKKSDGRLWFRPLAGKTVTFQKAWTFTNDAGLTIEVSKSIGEQGAVRQVGSTTEWIIPVSIRDQKTIKVTYEW